ncbi:UNVERIFIED_ORG: MFS family permease [Arthrobacter sp. UYCu721]
MVCCAFIAAVSTVFGTLAISYAKTVAGVDGTTTLWLVVGASLVALGTQPLFGKLADRIGRKPFFIYGAVASAILTPALLLSLESGSIPLMFLAAIGFFFTAVICGISAISALTAKETFNVRTKQLGLK